MNETIVVENGQAAVATTSVSGTLSPASSATDTIAIVDTPAGKQAALKVYNLNGGGGGGGEVSGDYLPLSGGTMTGELKFNVFGTSNNSFIPIIRNSRTGELSISVKFDSGTYYDVCTFSVAGDYLAPNADNQGSIGSALKRWKTVYTKKLNNGADLILPTEGGTLARLEDIDAAVGDISAALTAILGE